MRTKTYTLQSLTRKFRKDIERHLARDSGGPMEVRPLELTALLDLIAAQASVEPADICNNS